jgi:hypothetical protein
MESHVDCSTCSAAIARNYFYEGIAIFVPTERHMPFLKWLSDNYIDVKHDGIPVKGGYVLKRDASKYKNPLK